MGRLTERLTAALRSRERERFDVTAEADAPAETPQRIDPLSDNELLDRITDHDPKTENFKAIRDAASTRRIAEDQAFSRTAIQRFVVATLCLVAVILSLGFLCYAARGIHLSIPRPVGIALGLAGTSAVSAVGVALGRFLRRAGRDGQQ
ncbi:hypothetical protein AB0E08_20400 [Streptomyces sp. NPDC048281]|uniref:hypothetical protein n=1 Tax=Streptomyces sp. NPDC048281 TaxID=3154715 RepID=UPI00343B81D6